MPDHVTDLLIQACSKRKEQTEQLRPPLEVYDGYFFRIINKSNQVCENSIDIVVLSAEHGLLTDSDRITSYDREMSASRATELNDAIVRNLTEYVKENNYERIWVNVGRSYLTALSGIEDAIDVEIRYFTGRLGIRGKHLKRLLRGEESPSYQTTPPV